MHYAIEETIHSFSNASAKANTRQRMSASSIKRRIGKFCVVVVQWTSKKCTKKRDARAEQLFCS